MARCVSFVQSQEHSAAWAPCLRRARRGDILCTVHRDAVNGVVMGILHHSEPYHATKEQIEEAYIGAGARELAFETAIASLSVPPGHGIRPARRSLCRTRIRKRQKRKKRRARDVKRSGRREDATAAAAA
jgi:hypothetical protein